jgi:hypothetical protein
VKRAVVLLASLLTSLLAASPAMGKVMPLDPLPNDKLIGLAPLLLHGDVALVESNTDGTMKQVTLILLALATPETVHELLTHPGDFKKFIPNVSKSSWVPQSENSGLCTWQLDLPVSSFDQTNLYRFEPGPTGAVQMTCPEEKDDATNRWEMLPVHGGTIIVMYGYTDVKHSNSFVRKFLKKMPVTEHGLSLAAQMLLAANVKREAERRTPAGTLPPVDKNAKSPGFGFLLDRGQVAVMRSLPDGKLGDVSLLDRFYAPAPRILSAITRPGEWSKFIPGVDASEESARNGTMLTYHTDFAVPLVTWSTTYDLRASANTVEGYATSGDLRGAHFQWDLTPRGPSETMVVYRVNQRLAQSSVIFRKLIEYEPSLEHGLNVAFSLVYLRAIRGKAEGWLSTK